MSRYIFTLLFVAVFSVAVRADVVKIELPSTGLGQSAAGHGQGYDAEYDSNWRAGYLGEHGIGTESNGSHNGAVANIGALTDSWQSANMTSAFTYDNGSWPITAGAWGSVPAGTSWIGASEGFNQPGVNGQYATHDAGYYAYELDFNVGGTEIGTYNLYGNLAVDNTLIGILLDGNLIFDATGNDTYWQGGFQIDSIFADDIYLGYGDHTLTFLTANFGNADNIGNPAAFYGDNVFLQQVDSAVVPEPASILIFGLGLGGLGLAMRRRRR